MTLSDWLKRVRELAGKATPGEWYSDPDTKDYMWSLHIHARAAAEEDTDTDVAWFSCSQDGSQSGEDAPKLREARSNVELTRMLKNSVDLILALGEVAEAMRLAVNQQARDEGLWFVAETAPEAYLQRELRRLHGAIEYCLSWLDAILAKEQS